jgi:hypothetical protein
VRADIPDLTVMAEAGKVTMKGKGGATLSAESMKIPYRRKSAKER